MATSAPKQSCDLLIEARWVLPIAPANEALKDHAVAVSRGRVIAVGPSAQLNERFQPTEHVASPDGIVTPGLINAHGHAAMTLLRGVGEDLPLQTWLSERIWPLEAQLVSREFVRVGTQLAAAEMLLAGTTSFTDMYFFPEVVGEVAKAANIRAQLAFPIFDGATAWAADIDACFRQGLELHDAYRGDELVTVAFGPHAPYTVNQKALEKIVMISQEIGLGVHIHLHENAQEVAEAHQRIGQSWLTRLNEIGLINPQLQAVHMTQLTSEEIDIIANNAAHVVHCPHSNLKLASGQCPTTALRQAGVNIAIGTDGASSNNTLNMLHETRTASLLAKHDSQQADAGNVRDALAMATLGGANALGKEEELGSIEPGKLADLVLFEPSNIAAHPIYDPFASLVHGGSSFSAQHVWVGGRSTVAHGKLTTLDVAELAADVEQHAGRVRLIDSASHK